MLLLATQFFFANDWLIDVRPKTVANAVFQCLVARGHAPDASGTLPQVPFTAINECIETALA